METTITGKNQVTLPAELVRALGIGPGTRLRWSIEGDGSLRAVPRPSRSALARDVLGRGRHYLTGGADPVADLIAERASEDADRAGAPAK